jgi:hypothetical protein
MRSPDDWQRLATALDLRLAGWPLYAIGDYFEVSRERARQMVKVAERRLAWRLFGKPLRKWVWDRKRRRWTCG